MAPPLTFLDYIDQHGVSRRAFLKFCAAAASSLALPTGAAAEIAARLGNMHRPSVIWLSFQECTGCTESLTRSFAPTVENLMFNFLSLDYHHTLQAAAGTAAEAAKATAMRENAGRYLVVVEGAVPRRDGGVYSTIAGRTNLDTLAEAAQHAAAVIAVGSCAAFGGIPNASPNPTGAVAVHDLVRDKPVVNVPGCPPIPVAITGVVAHYLTFNRLPELDHLGRPRAFYGNTIHDRCYRRPFYDQGKFAKSFDDEGARRGWCLYELGCKGPVTYNSCATLKWNDGTSFPIESGHGCLGCSEPHFWDAGGFYRPLSTPTRPVAMAAAAAVGAGAAAGAAMVLHNRRRKRRAKQDHQPATVNDLEKK